MARKYVAFDIETARVVSGEDVDWRQQRPLGIACAAALACDAGEPTLWHGKNADGAPAPRMSRDECRELVARLAEKVALGYTLLTWNGLGFDLDVLAEESGAKADCTGLALSHVDMMFHVFCDRGFPVKLDKAAQALGIKGKLKGMSGELAPKLWAEGRHREVLDYVAQDVRITLDVARTCEQRGSFAWLTRKGSVSTMPLARGWLTVRDALRLPAPDTSWMDRPIPREQFTRWIGSV